MSQLFSSTQLNKSIKSSFLPIIPIVRNQPLPIIPKVRPLIILSSNNCQSYHNDTLNLVKCIPEKEIITQKLQQSNLNQLHNINEQASSFHFHSVKMNPLKPNKNEPLQQQARKMERQYILLFQQNLQLTREFQLQRQEYDSIINNYQLIKKQNNKNGSYFFEDRKKRIRRTADQIPRDFQCPDNECGKSYGSEGSLIQHLRLKHINILKQMQKIVKQQRIDKVRNQDIIMPNFHFQQNVSESSNKKIPNDIQKENQENVLKEVNILRPILEFGKSNKESLFIQKKQIKEFETGLCEKQKFSQLQEQVESIYDQNKF